MTINYIGAFLLITIGLAIIVLKKNLIKIVIGMGILDCGINLLLISIGFRTNGTAPIFADNSITVNSIISYMKTLSGNSMVVQRLRLGTFTAGTLV